MEYRILLKCNFFNRLLKGKGSILLNCSPTLGNRMEAKLSLPKTSLQEIHLLTSILEVWQLWGVTRLSLISVKLRYIISITLQPKHLVRRVLDSMTLHLGFVSACNINQERACPMYLSILCSDLYFVCQGEKGVSLAGFTSWFIWRSAYLTRVISWRNRFYVAMNWGTTLIFGRDNTKIG